MARFADRRGGCGDRTFAAMSGAAFLALLLNLPDQCCPLRALLVLAVGTLGLLIGSVGVALVARGRAAPIPRYVAAQPSLGAVIARLPTAEIGAVPLLLLLRGLRAPRHG